MLYHCYRDSPAWLIVDEFETHREFADVKTHLTKKVCHFLVRLTSDALNAPIARIENSADAFDTLSRLDALPIRVFHIVLVHGVPDYGCVLLYKTGRIGGRADRTGNIGRHEIGK